MEKIQVPIIAKVRSPYSSKFGIPRQSGIADDTISEIVFEKEYRDENALKGITEFSHLWILWQFSEVKSDEFKPTVRPPKLGGNKRVGVFATRSPYRPSKIGLSCVKLLNVEKRVGAGLVLKISGADMLDGTPVVDIKPYLPYADAKPDATGGFALDINEQKLSTVTLAQNCVNQASENDLEQIKNVLALDPRPGYKNADDSKQYKFEYGGYHVEFEVKDGTVNILNITKELGR